MVPLPPVDRASHGITDQPSLESRRLEAFVARLLGRERRLGGTVGDKLHAEEQATPADIADMRMTREPVFERRSDLMSLILDAADQLFVQQGRDHRMRGGAGRRMTEIGVAMLEEAASLLDRLIDVGAAEHRTDRLVSGAKPLGDGQDIGANPVRLTGEEMSGPAHPAHHLVQNQQHTVPVADLADAGEIAVDRRHRAKRRADHRLGNEGHHILRPKPQDFRLQLVGDTAGEGSLSLALPHLAIGIAGGDVTCLDKDRIIDLPPPGVAAGRQRAKGVAVIALASGDDTAPVRLAGLDEILPCELQRRLDRLRSAGDEIDMFNPLWRMFHQKRGKRLGRL